MATTDKLWLKNITKAGEYVDDLSKLRKEMEALAEKAKSTPQMINITYLGGTAGE